MGKTKFLKLLRVKPDEARVVFLSVLFAFCIGIVQNILFSVPLAMFLARFSSSYLPHIYIACGLSTFLVGIAFSYLEKTVSVFYVLALPIGLFSASLFLFWGLLLVVTNPVIFVALLIWSLLIISLIISIVMLLTNQLFTFQQTKRIYGLILLGISTGGIIIGFGMDFLIRSIGSSHLILLAATVLLFGFITQFLIRKHSGKRLCCVEETGESKVAKASFKSFKDKKYILSVFLLTAIVFFVYYSFDLLLNTAVQKHYPNETEMAVFYGILYAVYDGAALFAGLVLAGLLLSRFGLIFSLLVWPMGLALLLSFAFLMDLIPPFAGLVFIFILATAVFEVTLRECITEQSILLLFQPLRPVQRAWAQLKNETIVTPLSMAIIGAILLMIDKRYGIQLSVMSFIIVALSLTGIALIFFVLKKGYLNLLVESLSKRSITNPKFTKLNKDSLGVLKGHLKSAHPEEVIYVLQTIENIDQNEFVQALIESLDNPLEQVRCFSLSKIEKHRIKSVEKKVQQICLTEKNPAVLSSALLALAAVTGLAQHSWFKSYLENSNLEIASSCLIALIKYGSEVEKKEAIDLIHEKAKSPQDEERLIAANALKQIKIPGKVELLLNLLKDSNLEVRIRASEAAVQVADERLFSPLIENLEIPHVHDSASKSLTSFGKPFFEHVVKQFDHYSDNEKINLIKLLGFIKDPKVPEFLQKLLSISNRRSLHAVLSSLKKHSFKVTDEESSKIIKDLLESENENILYLKEMAHAFSFEKTKLLRDFLCREVELSQECCFSLLGFIYPESSIIKAEQGLALEDEDSNSNAIELLLQTLNKIDQKLLMEQLIYAPYKEQIENIPSEAKIEEFLKSITDYASNCFIPALSSAVIYEIGMLKIKDLIDLVLKQELKGDRLMEEIQPLSLKRLEGL